MFSIMPCHLRLSVHCCPQWSTCDSRDVCGSIRNFKMRGESSKVFAFCRVRYVWIMIRTKQKHITLYRLVELRPLAHIITHYLGYWKQAKSLSSTSTFKITLKTYSREFYSTSNFTFNDTYLLFLYNWTNSLRIRTFYSTEDSI